MACMVCENWAPGSSLLFCCTCGNHYHASCVKPSLISTPAVRLGWQCPDCKLCQVNYEHIISVNFAYLILNIFVEFFYLYMINLH